MTTITEKTSLKDLIHQAIEEYSFYEDTLKFLKSNLNALENNLKSTNMKWVETDQEKIDLQGKAKQIKFLQPELNDINGRTVSMRILENIKTVINVIGISIVGLFKWNKIVGILALVVLLFLLIKFTAVTVILIIIWIGFDIGKIIMSFKNQNQDEQEHVEEVRASLSDVRQEIKNVEEKSLGYQQRATYLKQMITSQKANIDKFKSDFDQQIRRYRLALALFPATFQNNLDRLIHSYAIVADGAADNWKEASAIVRSEEHLDKIDNTLKESMSMINQSVRESTQSQMLSAIKIVSAIDENTGQIDEQTKELKKVVETQSEDLKNSFNDGIKTAIEGQTDVLKSSIGDVNEREQDIAQKVEQQGHRITNSLNFQTEINTLLSTGNSVVAMATMERLAQNHPLNEFERNLL
ncbi:hypothetical protein LOOC260_116710 [Paucilactobacillus hokkaidonensis JCM 18461]|uniref:Uncharacterized protein n=2 Tax=Paucilactobacillus hokkaidonensis TaxID=1193095 RepID=A0A0A1GYV2_9LACO|nr:hypothetical protein [Paucilactobacillus hokkaidonensis]KRO08209.1 hypothetical protein IV59_GL001444 [Paucilactobacillus hokkaidonensis]BAP86178.1 hypothetical protein LOOC260_116710 [Paucilactobacillus hokkaidonensis JCM 18461]